MRQEAVTGAPAASPLDVDDVRRQHRAVRIELNELRGMIDSCRATQRTDGYRHMLGVLVGRLRDRLVHHFAVEQAGDPFGAVADHDALLAEGERLTVLLRAPAAPPDVVARTMRWIDALRQHEQAEDSALGS
jgi:hypothetical protein